MIISIAEEFENIFHELSNLVENNSSNPIFWIVLLLVMVAITFFGINNLGNK